MPSDFDLKATGGVIDLFYLMTLFGVVSGCHRFISHLAAAVLCGALTVYAVLRIVPCQDGVTVGMLAFGTSVICLSLLLNVGGLSTLDGILLCLGFPLAAYVYGAIYTEFRELDR